MYVQSSHVMNLLIVKWSIKKRFILLVLEILDQKQREQDNIRKRMKSGTLCNYKNRNYLIKDILLQKPAAQGQNLTK